MSKSIVIRGVNYNSNTINGLARRIKNADADLERFANAAAVQAIANRNLNWLTALVEATTLKSGKLSVSGKLAKSYILHHTKGLQWSEKGQKFGLLKEEKTGFKDEALLDDGQTFALTLAEFQALEKEKQPTADSAIQCKSIITSATNLLGKMEHGILFADKDQGLKAIDLLDDLKKQVLQALATMPDIDLDMDKLEQVSTVKPSSSAKAAGTTGKPRKNAA